jgi:tRNA U34 5-methylaminomethyl-2-thiouridine-forming methyltransferase MnmC
VGEWTISNYTLNQVQTMDGTYTCWSEQYNQHYHSTKDGAMRETLYKHILPAFEYHQNYTKKKHLNILDICFGLGYNTFSTLLYIIQNNLDITVSLYSPELDEKLINSLSEFQYPDEFKPIQEIIKEVIQKRHYKDNQFEISLFIGDAKEYIKTLKGIDIVYQDAFSSEVNQELWSKAYFSDIKDCMSEEGIITTYSISSTIRLNMYENGLYIYDYYNEVVRKSTLAFPHKQNHIQSDYIDMELKKKRNPNLISF